LIVEVDEAARLLSAGRVVAYPTETVFGLGADVFEPRALEALRALKGRDPDRGLSVLVRDLSALERWLSDIPETARLLAGRFWPGPLTLVLPVGDLAVFSGVATELGVGFRCSSHPTAAQLARLVARPIASTSCNRSGEEPCGSACEVRQRFGPELPIASGHAGGLPPSTVAGISPAGELRILREGAIPAKDLLGLAQSPRRI
jgi:L-threonylcarbamoyladenylate synthase